MYLLKLKIPKYFDETVFNTILFNEKIRIIGVFLKIKNPNPGDSKRPDPTGSGSSTPYLIHRQYAKTI